MLDVSVCAQNREKRMLIAVHGEEINYSLIGSVNVVFSLIFICPFVGVCEVWWCFLYITQEKEYE